MSESLYVGSRTGDPDAKETFLLKYANRHGLIAGATGTGKTVTLQGLAEGFSRNGVPVFMADVKGDLSGMAAPSNMEDFLVKRADIIGMGDAYQPHAFPVAFWDLFGESGHALRTTVSEMGPVLLARILELNDTQEGVLNIAFRIADEEGLLLLDLKDLRALLVNIGERAKEISAEYGNVSKASVGAIQRGLLSLEQQGAEQFFGEPALDLHDFMQVDSEGMGYINILAADKLMQTPRLYATFLLWLLSELFEELPEVGDLDKPKFVFFFDEAHLLFNEAPKSLIQKIEQVVKLIRSKGVGIYFVTQNPADIPDSVLSQLGNRIQHALRSFTPKQRKAIKQAAETYRANEHFDVETVITELGVGEALVSTLEKKGQPSIVQRTLIRPPYSQLGPITPAQRSDITGKSRFSKKYDTAVDRQSAYEELKVRAEKAAEAAAKAQEQAEKAKAASKPKRRSNRQGVGEAFVKTVVRTIGSQIGREIMRSVLGSIRR